VVVLATAQATTAGDDDLGGAEFGTLGLGEFAVVSVVCWVSGPAAMFSIFALIFPSTASKAVVRTVMTLILSAL
jgi:hypothetical protein